MKEAGEITLMALFLDSQDFMTENAEFLPDDVKTTLICESATYNESMVQSYNEKVGSLWEGIKKLGRTIWSAICTFFNRLANVVTGAQDKKIKELEEQVKDARAFGNFNVEQVEARLKAMTEKMIGYQGKAEALEKIGANKDKKIETLKTDLDAKDKELRTTKAKLSATESDLNSRKLDITYLRGQNTKLTDLVAKFSAVCTDKELAGRLQIAQSLCNYSVKLKTKLIVFEFPAIMKKITQALDNYASATPEAIARKGSNHADIVKLKEELNRARTTEGTFAFSGDYIQKAKEELEATRAAFEKALDDFAHKSGVISATNNVVNKDSENIDVKGSIAVTKTKGDVHGEVTKLVAESKAASGVVIANLNSIANARSEAIKSNRQNNHFYHPVNI